MNKKFLPLMYSFVFCRVFIVIVLVDFRLHCVTTVTPFIRRRRFPSWAGAEKIAADSNFREIKRFLVRLVQDPCKITMTSLDFVLSMVHFYVLPSPPGQPRGQVQPFRPGGGELFEAVLSRGRGAGQIKKKNFLLFL